MAGLQEPILGQKMFFAVAAGDFVQILHDGNLHWITVSNIHCESNRDTVDVYDSLYSTIPMNIKMQIASLMMSKSGNIVIRNRSFQHQTGGVDCGLFAIASATTLCNGEDPARHKY